MNEIIIITTTLISGFLIIYHHLGYPLILRWIQNHRTSQVIKSYNRNYTANDKDKSLPTITVIIPAFNEQKWIADKIRNLCILDYPENLLKIIIACDGCNDNTAEIATLTASETECHQHKIEIIDFKKNRGKVAIINEIVEQSDSDLIALSDVSALVSIDALLIAATRFNDPEIGVLNGHYRLLNPGSTGEEIYWQYQSRIKSSEAALGSTLGAHGAFYLFRRSLFTPLEVDTINDDFILPMKIVASGYRAEYENRIQALELEGSNTNMDQKRRRRIAAGNCQQILRLKNLMLPSYGGVAFAFISGKGLRVLMPFFMLTALIGSLMLSGTYLLFSILSILQLFIYLLAGYQIFFKPEKSNRIIESIAYLVRGHFAGLIGSLRYLSGLEHGRWKRVV